MSEEQVDPDDYTVEVDMEHGETNKDKENDTRQNRLRVPSSQYHPGQTPRRVSTQREQESRGRAAKEFTLCGECNNPLNTQQEKQLGAWKRFIRRNWLEMEQGGSRFRRFLDDHDDEDGESKPPTPNRGQSSQK